MSDVDWMVEARRMYELSPDIMSAIITVSRRARVDPPMLSLSTDELRYLVPRDSPHERDALGMLLLERVFAKE
jgi:hypothetical protein